MEEVSSQIISTDQSITKCKDSLVLPQDSNSISSIPSSPYTKNLPSLSPNSIKFFSDGFMSGSSENKKKLCVSNGQITNEDTLSNSSLSANSTDSGCPNAALISADANKGKENGDDIEFFVQVATAFRNYVSDQINLLEDKLKKCQETFKEFQDIFKQNDEQFKEDQIRLTSDMSKLTNLLFQQQSQLKNDLQDRNKTSSQQAREDINLCRELLKSVSGTLAFAKNLRQYSNGNFQEKSANELKLRLKKIYDLENKLNKSSVKLNRAHHIDVTTTRSCIEKLSFEDTVTETQNSHLNQIPVIEASQKRSDITKDSVLVRWKSSYDYNPNFQIEWKYKVQNKTITRSLKNINQMFWLVQDLPSLCDVIVHVRNGENVAWSSPALFTTSAGPKTFKFDNSTAHSKLRLSRDSNTVYYGGDNQPKSSSSQSSSRFTFALNVLGDIAFYTGRHYFEIKVNNEGWAAGVAYQSIARNSWLGSNHSSWILHFNGAKYQYKIRHAGESTDVQLALNENFLSKIGIYIDYESGILKFVNCREKSVLHTCVVEGGFVDSLCAAVNPFYHGGRLTLISGLDIPDYLVKT